MSDAAGIIARLDAAIERRGQTIRLRRLTTGPDGARIPFEVKFKAQVRAAGPSEPGADTVVVISPTDLARTRYPGLPRRDDHLVIYDDPADIQRIQPIYDNDELVRVRVTCRG